jgi:ZIP family zinc transporter
MFQPITSFVMAGLAFVSTCAGGGLAYIFQDKLHRVLGFSAGFILGLLFFDLFPEVFGSAHTLWPAIAVAVGFLGFHVVEKLVAIHGSHEHEYNQHSHAVVGQFAAGALIVHSLLDGIAIGASFLISPTVGLSVSLAILAHDFTDGMNTVAIMLQHQNKTPKVLGFLLLDAAAPIVGVALSLWFQPSAYVLQIIVAVFAGFLLYIAASDILPEAHSRHPSKLTLAFTTAGLLVAFVISMLLRSVA